MQYLEDVSSGVAEGAVVAARQLQVLVGHLPDGRVEAGEQGRVVQVPLGRHNALHARLGQTAVHVRQVLDVAVGEHRDTDRLSVHGRGRGYGSGRRDTPGLNLTKFPVLPNAVNRLTTA